METMSSSGTLEYMVEQFLPGAIMVVVSIALVAWMVRLGLFFWNHWRRRDEPNPHENKETMARAVEAGNHVTQLTATPGHGCRRLITTPLISLPSFVRSLALKG